MFGSSSDYISCDQEKVRRHRDVGKYNVCEDVNKYLVDAADYLVSLATYRHIQKQLLSLSRTLVYLLVLQ